MGPALFWLFSHPSQFRQNCSAVLPVICKASNSITWGHQSPSEPSSAQCCRVLWALSFTPKISANNLLSEKGEVWNLKLFLQGVRMTVNITAAAGPNLSDLTLITTVQPLPSHNYDTFTFSARGMMLEGIAISPRFVLKHSPLTDTGEGRMDPPWPDMNNSVAKGKPKWEGAAQDCKAIYLATESLCLAQHLPALAQFVPQDTRVPKGQLTGKLKDLLRIVLQWWKQTEQASPISSYLKEHKHFSSRATGILCKNLLVK